MAITHPTGRRNTLCNTLVDLCDTGGTGTEGDVIITTGGGTPTTLVTINLNDPAFGAASTGTATLDLTGGLTGTAGATGTAAVFQFRDKGNAAVFSGTVGTATSADLQISNTSISSGEKIEITSFTYSASA